VVIVGMVLVFLPPARGALHSVASPLWRAGAAGSGVFDGMLAAVRLRRSLEQEVEDLKEEVRKLQFTTLELPLIQEENRRLLELWQRRSFEEALIGKVLARPNVSAYDTLVLDVGALHGVSEGDLVVADGASIGSVSHIFSRTSIVQLFSAPGVKSNVSIGKSPIFVEAVGRGSGNFIAEVPRGVDVSEEDVVTLPDISARVFAVVESVQADPSDPFRVVLFKLPLSLSDIDWVEVIVEGAYPLPTEYENDGSD